MHCWTCSATSKNHNNAGGGKRLKKRFAINVLEQDLSVLSDKGDEYVEGVVQYVNERAREIKEASENVSNLSIAILVALNIADELFKTKEEQENLTNILKGRTERLIEYIDGKKQRVTDPLNFS